MTAGVWVTWAQPREITLAALHLQGEEGSRVSEFFDFWTVFGLFLVQLVEWAAS